MKEREFYFKPDTIYCGDNLKILEDFPAECVDLIYIDPPFFSGRNYDMLFKDPTVFKEYVVIKDKGNSLSIAFRDMFDGKIDKYLDFMIPRIKELHRVLKSDGSFWLHADWHASHYLKIECDKIFGEGDEDKGRKLFQNEIVWCYTSGGASKNRFARKHDVILFYSKSNKYNFNTLKYKRYALIKNGKEVGFDPRIKYFKDEKGTYRINIALDWWNDIGIISPNSKKERLGYPTQKPEKLLERIIKASSNEGDLVLDAFCGCGTSLAVAKKLGRDYIGIDESVTACFVMAERIGYPKKDIIGLDDALNKMKKDMHWKTFQVWTINSLGGIANSRKKEIEEKGIDGWLEGYKNKFKENIPIEVKKSKSIGIGVIQKFDNIIRREKKSGGIIIGLDKITSGSQNEIERLKNEDNTEIIFVSLNDLLSSKPKTILKEKGIQPLSTK